MTGENVRGVVRCVSTEAMGEGGNIMELGIRSECWEKVAAHSWIHTSKQACITNDEESLLWKLSNVYSK